MLGVKAVVGRMIGPADGEEPGKHPIAVISSSLWNDRFQGSPHVIGKKLQLDGRTFDIIGAAPSRFFGVEVGAIVDVWIPVSMAPLRELNDEHLGWLQLMGRRKPQVSLA